MNTKNITIGLITGMVMMGILALPTFAKQPTDKGFNEFGYNYNARIFQGKADGVDKMLDGKVWGDPTYASDMLVMKWNAEWDRGNEEDWQNGPYRAWEDNEWNGQVPGGSGYSEHYKIVWVGPCGANGTELPSGGYCIWNQFAVIFDQGNGPDGHFWYTHANPSGYGIYVK